MISTSYSFSLLPEINKQKNNLFPGEMNWDDFDPSFRSQVIPSLLTYKRTLSASEKLEGSNEPNDDFGPGRGGEEDRAVANFFDQFSAYFEALGMAATISLTPIVGTPVWPTLRPHLKMNWETFTITGATLSRDILTYSANVWTSTTSTLVAASPFSSSASAASSSSSSGATDTPEGIAPMVETGNATTQPPSFQLPKPQCPVVLCHGLLGFDVLGLRQVPLLSLNYWGTIPARLVESGVEVFVTRVPPSSNVRDRATALYQQLAKSFPGKDLNLVGHSMGGLDCRYMASVLLATLPEAERPFRIKSITTLVTPHRGSPFAEWVIGKLGIDNTIERRLQRVGLDVAALACLTPEYCATVFNPTVVDQPDILYLSYGAAATVPMISLTPLEFPYRIIEKEEGPNDGLVSVSSAKWGEALPPATFLFLFSLFSRTCL